jgi:DNA invertase Pin-like site-specific DNA recombinase
MNDDNSAVTESEREPETIEGRIVLPMEDNNMNDNKRAAAYIRFKADTTDIDGSRKRQQERITAYIKKLGITDIEFYIDEQTSKNYRPTAALEKLIEDTKRGIFAFVCIDEATCLSRDFHKADRIISVFRDMGVPLHSARDGFCLTAPTSRLSEEIQKLNELLHKKDLNTKRTAAGQRKRGRDNER